MTQRRPALSALRLVRIVVALLAVASFAACVPSAPPGPLQVVNEYTQAAFSGDGAAACSLTADQGGPMTKDRGDKWDECLQRVFAVSFLVLMASADPTDAKVERVTITGETASVAAQDYTSATPDKLRVPIKLARIDGLWYVATGQLAVK